MRHPIPQLLLAAAACVLSVAASAADQPDYLPPWNPPPAGLQFSVPPFDAIADLHGDIVDPQLVVFFAGNQFMVVHDLMDAFRQAHPAYRRIFVETLPPGILAKQIESGSLVMGNLRITHRPDVYTAGKGAIADRQKEHGWFAETHDYARNPLAILVARGNPKHITGLADLGRGDVRVSMPNPAWEGIAKQIEASYRKAGGEALDHTIMQAKVADGTTFLTRIHHRQSPLRVLQGASDAAPVWSTEAYFQQQILHHPVETVAIPEAQNAVATYTAARMKNAPHEQAAKDFMAFMQSPAAAAVYRKYGFLPAH
ncbi:substrate-binding domain-containing protein [Rhodanobacter sp. FDAARGOS 1247]|uniref:substrate-binding domain-containing protein n=1 Tax=Rhodanobacter sp. FDAARGOS 1247 TaxID=2778082 RepID=UPI00194F424D|nr:substrate-binding domain-containing protein [Rhodanobacter sp. FDAARGOS 1247]QRP64056.1 substrate-binding domain-containing protein [Rhodanobacter sp. FDAARGOS 1247]